MLACLSDPIATEAPPTNPSLDAVQIERLLSDHFGVPRAGSGRIRVRGPLAANSYSTVFRGDGDAFPGSVAIKQFLRDHFGASPAEAGRAYYTALVGLSSAEGLRLSVARPLALLDNYGLVVTSWIDGPTLPAWLLVTSGAESRDMVRKAGIWLARLHELTRIQCRPHDVSDALARLDAEIAEIGAPGRVVNRAIALLRTTSSYVAEQPVPWSQSHGDFKPANLIVCKNEISGFDLDLLVTAPAVNDVAHFLNHLQLLFYSPRALLRRHEAAALIRSFDQGYADESGAELPQLALVWERLRNATHLLVRHKSWSRYSMRWPARIALSHLVGALSDELASSDAARPAPNHDCR